MHLDRRSFLSLLGSLPLAALASEAEARSIPKMPFDLPSLPYSYDALEPHIDAKTMQIHYGRHHNAYLNNLNAAALKFPTLKPDTFDDILRNLSKVPAPLQTAIRNHGGGHYNHSLFWKLMAPKAGGQPTGEIAKAITSSFGSFASFKNDFKAAGLSRFGSGWVWLIQGKNGKLQIVTTPNQDNPWMEGFYPILGNDVWEHAYYLRYQNQRDKYLEAWWSVVSWEEVNKRFAASQRLR